MCLPVPNARYALVVTAAVVLLLAGAPDPGAARPLRADVRGVPAAHPGDDVLTTTVTTDPDDTPGRLDLAAVEHRVRQRAGAAAGGIVRVRWTVRTRAGFDPQILQNRFRRFTLELDTDGEAGAERNVRLVARRSGVVAEVVSNATREVIATVPALREDHRSLSFAARSGLVGARRYFWYSDYHARGSAECGRGDGFPVVCQDIAPERGWIRLDRPAWPRHPQ
jgi:hypothetical protein